MEILPLRTRRLERGDDLAAEILASGLIRNGDIVVVSSKVIAVTEGSAVNLTSISPGAEAVRHAKVSGLDPAFIELVLQETRRMNGSVCGVCPHAILTALKPDGMKQGRILCPNAGVDQSNAAEGSAIPWPADPAASARNLHAALGVPVIVSDSGCHPGRLGVTAFALTVSGLDPMNTRVGTSDLFGKTLRVTQEATADQLATAANAVMGNAAESVPAAIIRGHGIAVTDFSGWVDGIAPEEDLFHGMI